MDVLMSMLGDLADLFQQAAADRTPIARSSEKIRWSSPRPSSGTTRTVSGSTGSETGRSAPSSARSAKRSRRGFNKEQGRLVKAIERAEAQDGATRSRRRNRRPVRRFACRVKHVLSRDGEWPWVNPG